MLDRHIHGAEIIIDDIVKLKKSLEENADYVSDFNLNNESWREFADGAILGRELKEDLTILCSMLRTELEIYINNICNETTVFLEEQKEHNRNGVS